jgi:hypothetical protein
MGMLLRKEFSRLAAAGSSDDGLGSLVRRSQLAWVGRRFSREGCGYQFAKDFCRGSWVISQLVIGQLAMVIAFCDGKQDVAGVGADDTSR